MAASVQQLDDGDELTSYADFFPHFSPLLQASRSYASLSGWRFRSRSFEKLPEAAHAGLMPEAATDESDPRLAAKIRAAPAVSSFSKRLLAGDPYLEEELKVASDLVYKESVRNALIASFPRLDLWPPAPAPSGINADDCSYEDLSAPLTVIAQRLHNDEERRSRDSTGPRGYCQEVWRARLAFFITDFAEGIGAPLPPMPESQSRMLKDFAARVAEWEEGDGRQWAQSSGLKVREVFLSHLGNDQTAEKLRAELGQFFKENKKAVVQTVLAGFAFGPLGAGAAALWHYRKHRKSAQQQQSRTAHEAAAADSVPNATTDAATPESPERA
mmetsp:Transcript_132430/g.255060  ORF Transcript_132430/g.255060 Transcript_132430/m.255060 type:complete len:329 (-) Transcript_132430:8-994(-)